MELIENREAQFMLLAGFIIAIGLVIITVLFNNIIFQTNIAGSTGADPLKYDVANMMQITSDEMKSAYRNATSQSGNNAQKINNYTMQMQNFNSNLSKIYALRAGGVNMSMDVRNWNDSRYANFTENGTTNGATNWTVMESVKNISVFALRNVSGTNFEVNISNQTTGAFLWSLKLIASNQINITNRSSVPFTHTVNYTYIDLLNSSYNLSTSIRTNISKIMFLNGSDAAGTFNMTGNTTYGSDFIRARDYILNATVTLSTSEVRADITIPVSVPW